MAQPTMKSVIDLARQTLNDADKTRDSDADLLKQANRGLDEIFLLRPDLFIGSLASSGATEGHQLALDDPLPIDARWRGLLAEFICAHADMKDDEHVNSARAGGFLKHFESRLIG